MKKYFYGTNPSRGYVLRTASFDRAVKKAVRNFYMRDVEKMEFSKAAESLAYALRVYRSDAGITQKELAKKAGVSVDTVSRYESGRTSMRLDVLVSLFDALGVDMHIDLKSKASK